MAAGKLDGAAAPGYGFSPSFFFYFSSLVSLLFLSLFFSSILPLYSSFFFSFSPLFFLLFSPICFLFIYFFLSVSFFYCPSLFSALFFLVFVGKYMGREAYYPCLVMAQGLGGQGGHCAAAPRPLEGHVPSIFSPHGRPWVRA